MKKILLIFVLLFFSISAFSFPFAKDNGDYTSGSFKRNKKGEFVQYNKKGKKIGVYKIINGKFVKIK